MAGSATTRPSSAATSPPPTTANPNGTSARSSQTALNPPAAMNPALPAETKPVVPISRFIARAPMQVSRKVL